MEIYTEAKSIPEGWDAIVGDNYALKRSFLEVMELGNPSSQKYYLFRNSNGDIDSLFVTYVVAQQNITLYTPFNYRVKATFVHVPLSVTRQGYILGSETRGECIEAIKKIKGYVIILNARDDMLGNGFGQGYTASEISLNLRWSSLDSYLQSLRSGYRYRYRKALKKFSALSTLPLHDNNSFTPEMYALYENVHNKSRIQAEKLTIEYFRGIPARIIVSYCNNKPVGFVQLIENESELIFGFVGLDYSCNKEHDTYLGLLLTIIDYGLTNGFTTLELGQTAEDAKLKLGGVYTTMHVLMHHSNPIFLWFIKKTIKTISYREYKNIFNVFKGGPAS